MTTTQPTFPTDAFSPFAGTGAEPLDQRWLCHLLRRAAFGPNVKRLSTLRGKNVGHALDWLFEFDAGEDPLEESADNLEGFINFTRAEAVASFWFYRMMNSPQPL